MTVKQQIGQLVFRSLPVSRHVFDHVRLELNAVWVRVAHRVHPVYLARLRRLRKQKSLLVNVGCGPFGKAEGWINLDLHQLQHVYIRTDCRRRLPVADGSCRGIHVEMFLEHLDPVDELPFFLADCHRALDTGGVLRVIVPDAELFVKAYLSPGWRAFNQISYGGEDWEKMYAGKMEALNHVFLQGYEHYGGWDFERVDRLLRNAGFGRVQRTGYGQGSFPGGSIDRDFHQQNAIYVEATK